MLEIKAKEQFGLLRQPVDHKAWGDTAPSVVNAFYEPSRNQISMFLMA
jgi:predicted metalloendopeptidase